MPDPIRSRWRAWKVLNVSVGDVRCRVRTKRSETSESVWEESCRPHCSVLSGTLFRGAKLLKLSSCSPPWENMKNACCGRWGRDRERRRCRAFLRRHLKQKPFEVTWARRNHQRVACLRQRSGGIKWILRRDKNSLLAVYNKHLKKM